MYRAEGRKYRVYGLSIAVIAVMAAALSNSCIFEPKSVQCENGVICPQGWACTAALDGCTPSKCGNHVIDPGEECDDGNLNDKDACVNCEEATCGDGYVRSEASEASEAEDCDDSNAITEECTYGTGPCKVCDSTCHEKDRERSACGDGKLQPQNETCDDGNQLECGTCSSNCGVFKWTYAIGQITVVAASRIVDNNSIPPHHDTFTLNDGINPAVIFEFDKDLDDSVTGDNVRIPLNPLSPNDANSESYVRDKVEKAINSHPLLLIRASTTSQLNNIVTLKHMIPTALGNSAIPHTVADMGFSVIEMHGGEGANCPDGTGCKSDADCKHVCLPDNTCGCRSNDDCRLGTCNLSNNTCQ